MKTRLIAAAAMLLLATTAPGAYAQGTLNVGMAAADVGQLDPHRATTTQDKPVVSWIFNGLVRFKPGSASLETLEPDLAEKWEASPDKLTWTFTLRKGVKFHGDYGELTADDVVFSLKRAADSKTSSFAADYAAIDTIEAVDPLTVRIKLKQAIPSLLGLVTNYHGGNIVSKKAVEALGADFRLKPIGTGPFVFQEYKPNESLTLVANKSYFRGARSSTRSSTASSRRTRRATSPSRPASSTSSMAARTRNGPSASRRRRTSSSTFCGLPSCPSST